MGWGMRLQPSDGVCLAEALRLLREWIGQADPDDPLAVRSSEFTIRMAARESDAA